MAKRESKWTHIYWDFMDGKMKAYVRLIPDFMDTEQCGYPHGLSIGNSSFDTEAEAIRFADSVDAFMYTMMQEFLDDLQECREGARIQQKAA